MTIQVVPNQPPYNAYCELAAQRSTGDRDQLLLVPFSCPQEGQGGPAEELLAIYWFSGDSAHYSVLPDAAAALAYWRRFTTNLGDVASASTSIGPALTGWLAKEQAPLFALPQPLPLQPVYIPKPWGREIWYTGVESRGVARFGTCDRQTPIPHVLAAMPALLGQATNGPLLLLKILDPLPEEIFGDLYFELHNEKREVYVVTHVDRRAWPDGVGRMRLGFQPEAIRHAGSQVAFRQRFLKQVVAYRDVRFEIDRLLDARRREYACAPDQPLPVARLKEWLGDIPAALASRESCLRQAMESYYGSLPLQAGDVVQVPLNVPHSLQHGVRTIEFQTPIYERRIVAFGQKVLTQATWDTEQAVEEMEIVAPSRPRLPVLLARQGLLVEQVVDFPDFQVQRINLAAESSYEVHGMTYQLLIVLQGELKIYNHEFSKEQAVLLPALTDFSIRPRGEAPATFLIAIPNV